MSKVLLACLKNSRNMQEVPFVLKRGGCEVVDVLCSPRSSLLRNKFYNRWIEHDSNPHNFKTLLLNSIATNQYDWIILGDDTTLKAMNEAIEDDELFRKILPMNKIENRMMLSSKVGLSEVCNRLSILTPKYLVLENNANVEDAAADLKFPVLIKVDVSQGGRGIRYCNNIDELKGAVNQNIGKSRLIIQEYISGKDIGAEALYKNGKLLTYNVCEVLEYLEGKFGRTTKRRYFYNLELENLLVDLGEKLGLNGFASIQYIYGESEKKYYLVEADLRPNIWVAASRFTCNDFATGVKRYIGILPAVNECYKPDCGYNVSMVVALFNRDIVRCIRKGKGLQLLEWLYNYRYWRFIPTYDKRQLRFQVRNTVRDVKNSFKRFITRKIAGLEKVGVFTFRNNAQ
jgi:hypothetical protein